MEVGERKGAGMREHELGNGGHCVGAGNASGGGGRKGTGDARARAVKWETLREMRGRKGTGMREHEPGAGNAGGGGGREPGMREHELGNGGRCVGAGNAGGGGGRKEPGMREHEPGNRAFIAVAFMIPFTSAFGIAQAVLLGFSGSTLFLSLSVPLN